MKRKAKPVAESEWKWYGLAGHFICGRWCRFHLATEIGPYLISTMGQYVHPRNSGASEASEAVWLKDHPDGEEVGRGRCYETMVFRTTGRCESRTCGCGLPTIDPSSLDFEGYMTAREASAGHLAMCKKWSSNGGATMKRKAKPLVEFYRVGGDWYWRAKAKNGRIVCDGAEGYKRLSGAVRGASVAATSLCFDMAIAAELAKGAKKP